MKALQIFNVVALLLTATFFMVFGVVCLMYGYHLESSARMQAEWPALARITLMFAMMSAACALAVWAQRRQLAWRWPAQLIQLCALTGGGFALLRLLQ